MKIKCAIFDFDGTLFDSMHMWANVGEIYLHSLGKEPKASIREDVKTLSLYQAAYYFQKEYDVALSADEIVDGINKTIEHFNVYEVLPKPGVCEFLDKMKQLNIPMCIATAIDRAQVIAALKRCKMEQYFDEIFTSNEVGTGKDEPMIYRKAMKHFDADYSTSIVFEDALYAAQTAKKDGFKVIAVYDSSETQQEEMQQLCEFYLLDFERTENFWNYIFA